MIVVLQVIAVIVFIYFAFNVAYLLVYALAGAFSSPKNYPHRQPVIKFCVMIPAYKGDEVIVHALKQNLLQQYPRELYDVYIIADSFRPETLEELKKYDVRVIEVHFENSTKAKSINRAFEVIEEKYDYVVLLDVDNIMEQQFLQKLNNRLVSNVQVLQAHRVALNTETSFAVLDAISEEINNHIFRKGHIALGFSAALIGSGKAVGFRYFKDIMREITAIGGFDKELELRILKQRVRIHYLEDAYVFDEKTSQDDVFQNQRRRWMSAQLHYLRNNFTAGFAQFFRGNMDFVDKWMQLCLLPRVLLLGLLTVITGLHYIAGIHFLRPAWLFLFLGCIIAFAISVPLKYYSRQTLKALMSLPRAFLLMFINLFKLKGSNKKFIHTPHKQQNNQP